MTLEVYGRIFDHGHERKALGIFLSSLKEIAEKNNLHYYIIIEFEAYGASIDLLIISKSNAMIIADLKELTGLDPDTDGKKVKISAYPNGQWYYTDNPNSRGIPMGGFKGKGSNPYMQLRNNRFEFAKWIADSSKEIFNKNFDKDQVLNKLRLQGWVVISPGFDGNYKSFPLDWDEIRRHDNWFQVISLSEFPNKVLCARDINPILSQVEIENLLKNLGVPKMENWDTLLPGYYYKKTDYSPSLLFSLPIIVKIIIGREKEIKTIQNSLSDENKNIVCITGIGGIGKTELVSHVIGIAKNDNWQDYLIECNEREVTTERILLAFAERINDPIVTSILKNKEDYSLAERIDRLLLSLMPNKLLIIFDDFHKIENTSELVDFLIRIKRSNIKIILITRTLPPMVDSPAFLGCVEKITLSGIKKEFTYEFFKFTGDQELTSDQIKIVWEKTGGNPYVMKIMMPIVRNFGWEKIIHYPLFTEDHRPWFESLIEYLSKEALDIAKKLSVFRKAITQSQLEFIIKDKNKLLILRNELLDSSIIQSTETEEQTQFIFHEYLREFIESQMDQIEKRKAHMIAAKTYYPKITSVDNKESIITENLYQVIFHLNKSESWEEILNFADQAYELLVKSGDRDRAYEVARITNKATSEKRNIIQLAKWLTRMAQSEFELENLKIANENLDKALENLKIALNHKPSTNDNYLLEKIRFEIFHLKGRIAHRNSEIESSIQFFTEAYSLAEKLNDKTLQCDCLMRRGSAKRRLENFHEARDDFEIVLSLSGEIEKRQVNRATTYIGLIEKHVHRYPEAEKYFMKALENAEKDSLDENFIMGNLGDLWLQEKRFEEASMMFRECIDKAEKLGNARGLRILKGQLAETLIYLGELEEANTLLIFTEENSKSSNDKLGLVLYQCRYGMLLKKQGKIKEGDRELYCGIQSLIATDNKVYVNNYLKHLNLDLQNQLISK